MFYIVYLIFASVSLDTLIVNSEMNNLEYYMVYFEHWKSFIKLNASGKIQTYVVHITAGPREVSALHVTKWK